MLEFGLHENHKQGRRLTQMNADEKRAFNRRYCSVKAGQTSAPLNLLLVIDHFLSAIWGQCALPINSR